MSDDISATPVYSYDNLPLGKRLLYRKISPTPMIRVNGPFIVQTQEGPITVGDDWEGYIAIDRAKYPYPVELEEARKTYEQMELS